VARSQIKGETLKQSPFQGMESLLATQFKQIRVSNAVISGTLLREKAQGLALKIAKPQVAGLTVNK
jgi:hypothetical protein